MTLLRSVQDADTAEAQKVRPCRTSWTGLLPRPSRSSDIVSVVGDSLPPGTWLTGLGVERGKRLQIRGTAKSPGDVPRVVHALGVSPRFRDVRLVFANSVPIGKARLVEFDISAVCVGNLPLSEPDKTGERPGLGQASTVQAARPRENRRQQRMISFRRPEDIVPSLLMLLSILVLAGTLAYMLLVPKPSAATSARAWTSSRRRMVDDIADTRKQTRAGAGRRSGPRLWHGDPEAVTATVLAQMTEQTGHRALKLTAFRPERPPAFEG